ncbi:MAG: transglycosylase SLT domain-containing protein [bacterium]
MAVAFAVYISPKEEPPIGAIQKIKDRGYLIAAVEPNTLNYFVYRGEAMGFSLDLLYSFSRYLQVPLKVLACSTVSQAYYYLDYHVADIMAYTLPVTRLGRNLSHFSKPLEETPMVLVQRSKVALAKDTSIRFISSLEDFQTGSVVVQQNLFYQPVYDKVRDQGNENLVLIEQSLPQEELYRRVSQGVIAYTICPQNLALVLQAVYPNTEISLVLTRSYPIAWAVNHTSDSLLLVLDTWIDSIARKRELRKIYRNYYHNPRVINHFGSDYFSLVNQCISPWDEQIKHYSKLFWWDWRLVASLIYEESNFVQGLTSHRSAYGLMQMIPETAEVYGLDTSSSPSHQIMAGIKYLKWIDRQLPSEIRDPKQRASFILAAYNVGIGRVLALRKKAEKFGKDPNKWQGNVEYYLLRRSQSDPYGYADTLRDFPVDYTMDGYVDGILNRYYHYLNLIPQ